MAATPLIGQDTGARADQRLAQEQNPAAGRGDERTAQAPATAEQLELEKLIQDTLVDLVKTFERDSDNMRKPHFRRLLKSEEFWKGNHHLVWSERNSRWFTPFEKTLEANKDSAEEPRYQYVCNWFQSLGLAFIAAISRRLPKVRFQPVSSKSERDLATASASSRVMEVIEENNELDMLAIRAGYLLWTQGLFGAYVRYQVDEEFGEHEEPVMEMQPVEQAPDRYLCPQCATESPAEVVEGAGFAADAMRRCPQCGAALDDRSFRPREMGEAAVVTGYKKYPNGREVITLYGALHLKLMPTAQSQGDSLYLILCEEKHQANVKAAYPGKPKATPSGGGGGEDQAERSGRIGLADAPPYQRSGTLPKMVTLKRAWLRPASFWEVGDDVVRAELFKRFPSGVKVVLADSEFLEAREEKLDARWRICRPMPGQGMYVESAGGSMLPLNEQFNDAANVKAEHVEFGSAPPMLYDARFIKGDALRNRRMEPASWYPVMPDGAGPTVKLSDMVEQIQCKIDSNIYSHGKDLAELMPVISHVMPSVFGGSLKGNDTASGYAMSREDALGTLTLFWRPVKHFWAGVSLIAVECFRDNRTEDYELVVFDKGKNYTSEYIHLEDLRGAVTARPEADEDFPASWAEIRENFLQIAKIAPEIALKLALHPSNAPFLKRFVANDEIIIPDEDDRQKQYREIDQLLRSQPLPPVQMGTDPEPSLPPELWIDNHDVHIATAKEWCVSDKGLEQKRMNPAGYANVMAHVVAHIKAKQQEVMFLQLGLGGAEAPQDPGERALRQAKGKDDQKQLPAGNVAADVAADGAQSAGAKLASNKVQ